MELYKFALLIFIDFNHEENAIVKTGLVTPCSCSISCLINATLSSHITQHEKEHLLPS